jgi:DNA uptake protein ComE-like DNA-binding protein
MRAAPRQEGFILAITLWVLALMTLAASFFAVWVQDALDITKQSKDDVLGEINEQSTLNVALYLLSTQKITPLGVTLSVAKEPSATSLPGKDLTLSVSGDAYRGVGGVLFSIQDEGGLIKPSSLMRFSQVLPSFGVPVGSVPPLLAKLSDYIDQDNVLRINGAEAKEYAQRRLPAPPNRKLFTSWETRAILDWGQYKSLWKGHAFPLSLTAVETAGIINFNTAPRRLLKAITELDDEAVQRLLIQRKKVFFTSIADISQAAGKMVNLMHLEMEMEIDPTNHYRILVWRKEGLRMREIHVKLTLADSKAPRPWLLDHSLIVPLTTEQKRGNEQVAPSPLFTQALLPRS